MRLRPKKKYDPAFKAEAIAMLVRTDRTANEVAKSLGLPAATLYRWYDEEMARRRGKPKAAPPTPAPASAASSAATETVQQRLARLERENAALRKENDDLKVDKEILKKAAAFFAKEST
jgi:transposase